MMEMPMTEKESGQQISHEGKPLMMHPVLDTFMQPVLDEDQNPMFFPAAIPVFNPVSGQPVLVKGGNV